MVFARKCIIVLVIFCLIGTIASACEYYEPKEEEKEETDFKEQDSQENPESGITESKWFKTLDYLIERFPIIERIIERIFQWIFEKLLGMEY